MTTPPDIERAVSQHRNDIDALYELQQKTDKTVRETRKTVREIATVQRDHGERLTGLEETQGSHTEKLDAILGLLRNGQPTDDHR